ASSRLRVGRVSTPGHAYLITTTTRFRRPFFKDSFAAWAACRCFETRALLRDARMLAWVLMPDHAHWLMQLGHRDRLECVVARLKSASARETNQVLRRRGAVWDKSFHDRAVRSDQELARLARYVVANP